MTIFHGTQAQLADELTKLADKFGAHATRLMQPYNAGRIEGQEAAYVYAAALVRSAIITEEPKS